MKKTVFSAIQPSGVVTVGNYYGAIKNWVSLQKDHNCVYMLSDYHSISTNFSRKDLHSNTIKTYALLLAAGIDPQKSLLFIGSHVGAHLELAFLIACFTEFDTLLGMDQFNYVKNNFDSKLVSAGFFLYPCLMASDILIHQADLVPVGEDQKSHVNFASKFAAWFNNCYKKNIKIPSAYIDEHAPKIMSLQDPFKKMSKTDTNENSRISILDDPKEIAKKISLANETKEGVENLSNIYFCITKQKVSYDKNFKKNLIQAICYDLKPIKSKFLKLMNDKKYLEESYKKAAVISKKKADETLRNIKTELGLR